MKRLLVPVVLVATLTACSGGKGETTVDPSSGPSTSSGASTSAAPAPPTATAAPRPADRACYDLDHDEAVAPTNDREPVDCRAAHTSMTFAVGDLDAVVDGHLLAVDSDRVQAQVAETCPEQLAGFIGGTTEDRRLSMLRATWFTPTVKESDAGAAWYRCDVIALAGDEDLARLTGMVGGVLDRPEDSERYAMCGTAEPGTPGFSRVICSSRHSWRAISTVPFDGGAYPGVEEVRSAGETPCRDAARAVADDSLSFQWGYEWPTGAQWQAGQTYGLCWAPDS